MSPQMAQLGHAANSVEVQLSSRLRWIGDREDASVVALRSSFPAFHGAPLTPPPGAPHRRFL